MKKIFTMLLTVILLVSQLSAISVFAASVEGTELDPIKLGDSAYYLAASNATTGKGGQIWEFKKPETDKPSSGYGWFIMGGGSKFEFYSDSAKTLKLTVKFAPWARSEDRTVLAFFNPSVIPTSYTSTMVEGTDYPARNTALIDHSFTSYTDFDVAYPAYTSTYAYMYYSNPADWPEYEYSVEAVEGKNTLWFPNSTLSYKDGEVTYPMYPYKEGKTIASNANTCLYSVEVEALEENGSVVYISDIEDKANNLLKTWSGGAYTENSYIGEDDDKGDTNIRTNYPGIYTSIPFTVNQAGDYIINVYYGMWRGTNTNSAMYIDYKPAATPYAIYGDSVQTTSTIGTDYLDEYNAYLTSLGKATVSAFPNANVYKWWCLKNKYFSDLDESKKITTTTWKTTPPLYDNSGDTLSGSTVRAPFFRLNSFEVKGLKAGEHIATFLTEREDVNSDGTFTRLYNNDIMINRIEIVPIKEGINPSITTYIYNSGSATIGSTTKNDWVNYLESLAEAKEVFNTNIIFGAEITNVSSDYGTAHEYIAIWAYYDDEGNLISAEVPANGEFDVPQDNTNTIMKEFKKEMTDLPQNTAKIKIFLWGNGDTAIIPAYSATTLE